VDSLFAKTKVDVVFHHTSSFLKTVAPQLNKLLGFGVNIVSTTEELVYPFTTHLELPVEIDKVAKVNEATILGTGVNPGFVMDIWPLVMTEVCQEVMKIKVVRIQDARPRRLPFQKKIGAGLHPEEFQKSVGAGTLGHAGLKESIGLIAAGLGWKLDDIAETIEPIIAKKQVQSQYITVKPGHVAGVRQIGRGLKESHEVITLEFEAYLGATKSYDAVYITGTPNIEAVIRGGIHGDVATAAIVVNAAHRVIEAPPGLLTMKDLPLLVRSI
jgi:4-hydroxy-tetrahydrodipicolinate reductase